MFYFCSDFSIMSTYKITAVKNIQSQPCVTPTEKKPKIFNCTLVSHLQRSAAKLRGCAAVRQSKMSSSLSWSKLMTDKVWLTDVEVGSRFGSTRQWVWVQARTNPKFPQPVKFTARFSRWSLQEIEAFEHEALAARG